MNAGAFGGETWRHVVAVETVDAQRASCRRGCPRTTGSATAACSGRPMNGSSPPDLGSSRAMQQAAQARIRALAGAPRRKRSRRGKPSCGSVFRNPPGDHAARLIEAAGLKGCAARRRAVSEKHANFIINTGTATAADIEALIVQVQERVEQTQGIRLETEVRIVGEDGVMASMSSRSNSRKPLWQGGGADGRPLGRARHFPEKRRGGAAGAAVGRRGCPCPGRGRCGLCTRTGRRRLCAGLHRPARARRRRRRHAGPAGGAGAAVYRQWRAGLGAGNGQAAHQAGVAAARASRRRRSRRFADAECRGRRCGTHCTTR